MATAPVKSQPLHNFSLPSFLKWGGSKVHAAGNGSSTRCRRSPMSGESPPRPPPSTVADHSELDSDRNDSESDNRYARVGSRTARNRFKYASCSFVEKSEKQVEVLERESKKESDEVRERKVEVDENEETVQRPWNLRPRKGLYCSSSRGAMDKNGELQEMVCGIPAVHAIQQSENQNQSQLKSLRLRGITESVSVEKEKRKLWIALSREEIEEDIFVMTGSRPARRPRKRPKNVQKQLDNVFPGLWLVGLTTESFRVA